MWLWLSCLGHVTAPCGPGGSFTSSARVTPSSPARSSMPPARPRAAQLPAPKAWDAICHGCCGSLPTRAVTVLSNGHQRAMLSCRASPSSRMSGLSRSTREGIEGTDLGHWEPEAPNGCSPHSWPCRWQWEAAGLGTSFNRLQSPASPRPGSISSKHWRTRGRGCPPALDLTHMQGPSLGHKAQSWCPVQGLS